MNSASCRIMRANLPPANIFDAEDRSFPLELRFDGSCSPGAPGSATVYFSLFNLDDKPHSIMFEIKSAACGTTCAYMVRICAVPLALDSAK